jgi:hypothetical protein
MAQFAIPSLCVSVRRVPLLVGMALVFGACNAGDSVEPDSNTPLPVQNPDGPTGEAVSDPALAIVSFAGGIPMGLFHLPTSDFGSLYNGAMLTPGPSVLLSYLAAIKARGGKVFLNLPGAQKYFKDSNGHFSFTKWKAQVDRFRNVNFSSYINDGTIVAHYLIDEPYDASNFNGQSVGGSTLEAMAKYSKQIWPGMATIVRAEPYKIPWSGTYYYLNAAWAQYTYRKGNVSDYLTKNVSSAQKMGLALVVGLAIHTGGINGTDMTASQVQTWGSTLLGSSYPCAFVSWKYGDWVLTSSMKSAMSVLRNKAQSRSAKNCRG